LASGFLRRASFSEISMASWATLSTTSSRRASRISPVRGSISARISFSLP
jgi:hypothetical protein